jgi:hypothetical protein
MFIPFRSFSLKFEGFLCILEGILERWQGWIFGLQILGGTYRRGVKNKSIRVN